MSEKGQSQGSGHRLLQMGSQKALISLDDSVACGLWGIFLGGVQEHKCAFFKNLKKIAHHLLSFTHVLSAK